MFPGFLHCFFLFVHLWETWLENNLLMFPGLSTFGKHGSVGNNVSWFVHLRETWLGNNVPWFLDLRETWLGNDNACFLVCPPLGNMARKNTSWFVHL